MLLAIVGLYGVLNYSVIRRTREIGIRLAIGAQPRSVMGLVMKDVSRQVLAGVVAGGLYLARFVETLLVDVEPLTLTTVALPTSCLLIAALLAALPPTRRAARVDPVTVLRLE